jgi:hypothetical protein
MFLIVGSAMGSVLFLNGPSLENLSETSITMMLLSIPVGWISGMLLKAMVVSLYLETVLVKEGGRTEGLSEVFG